MCPRRTLGQSDPGNLRIGVGDRRDDPRVEAAVQPCRHLGRDLALVDGFVCQHWLTNDVANGENRRDVRSHLLVCWDKALRVDAHTGVFRPDEPSIRLASYGHQ